MNATRSVGWRGAARRSLVAVVVAAAGTAAAAPQALQFLVRADGGDSELRCAVDAADRCRDDLDLPQVFAALRSMAGGAAPAAFGWPAQAAAVELRLGAGVFRLREELRLSGWNGAGRFGPLTISGAGADRSTVTGTMAVPAAAWRPVPDDEPRLPAAARPHVRVADLAALLPRRVDARQPATGFGEPVRPLALAVFAAGRPLTLARWPDTGWALVDTPANAAGGALAASARAVALREGHFDAWRDEPALRAVGYFSHDWAFERIPVAAVDSAAGNVLLQGEGAKFGVRAGQRVFIENALAELDSPGEWYFDTARQALYVWLPEGAAAADVEVAIASGLLRIADASGITVSELSLQGSTGDALRITGSRHVTLVDATLRNAGNRAVVIDGGNAVALRRVAMSDLGEGGVVVSGGDRHSLAPSGHVIEACRIERFALHSRSYRPAISVEGVGVQLLRNRVADGPHAAIVFGGNDHRIEGNLISDVVTETNDAGAIYTGRDWTARGTVIAGNLLQNVYARLPGTFSVMGIYLDDQASGTTIAGNVFANVSRAVLIGGGRDNVVERNIFVASSPAIFADNRGTTWQREQTLDVNGQLQRNLRNVPVASQAYRSRYPHLSDILEDEPGRSKYNRVSGNLFVESEPYQWMDEAEKGLEAKENSVVPWTVFAHLRGRKSTYRPADFTLSESPERDSQLYFAADRVPSSR